MYKSFYGFKEKPFNLTPDPDFLFMSRGHENTYTHIEYAISENKGFVVITGQIGSGKTTLINYFLRRLKLNVHMGIINHTYVQKTQFLKMICHEFELEVDGMDKTEMLNVFRGFLVKKYSEKKRVVLIIDEAQNLSDQMIEEIRMLSNFEAEKDHLIQILLVGQPELKYKLQKRNLEQFVQRVTVYCNLNGLNDDEVRQYIEHRLRVAGSKRLDMFNQDAVNSIIKYSHGIPRLINILCDAALVHGYADELEMIDGNVIAEVAKIRNIGGNDTEDTSVDISGTSNACENDMLHEIDQRIRAMDERIALLESGHGDQKSNNLSFSCEKGDEVVLQLTKILKQSMESQEKLMLEVVKLKQRERINNNKNSPQILKYF